MKELLQEKLDNLLNSYSEYFDVRRDTDSGGEKFAAECDFYSRSERYALVKKANLWAAETYEYAFIAFEEDVDLVRFAQLKSASLKTGLVRVVPHKEHMYTYITLVLVAEHIDEEVFEMVKKTKFRKNYLCTLHGWADYRVIVKELSSGKMYYNNGGSALKKLLRDI